jgi:hypothetical protein
VARRTAGDLDGYCGAERDDPHRRQQQARHARQVDGGSIKSCGALERVQRPLLGALLGDRSGDGVQVVLVHRRVLEAPLATG